MKISDLEHRREDSRIIPGRARRAITVRHFVIAVACLAATVLVYQRSEDALLAALAGPALYGCLNYWLVD